MTKSKRVVRASGGTGAWVPAKSGAVSRGGKKKRCKACGGPIDPETKKCTFCGKQASGFSIFRSPKRVVAIASLVIVFAALVGLNVYQYVSNAAAIADLEGQVKAKDETVAAQAATISTRDSTISTLSDENSQLAVKAENYDSIFNTLSSGNVGAASANFKVSEGVIVVPKGETKQVTLTAFYDGSLSVYYSGSSASISYADRWRLNTIPVFFKGLDAGVTVYTFKDDSYSLEFKVVVIVTG